MWRASGGFPRGTPEWDDAAFGAVADALGVTRAGILGRRSLRVRTVAISLLADELGLSAARAAAVLGIRTASAKDAIARVRKICLDPWLAERVAVARGVLNTAASDSG